MSEEHHNEEWRPVVGYEGWYSVSNTGMVRRERKEKATTAGRIRTSRINKRGYLYLCIFMPGKNKTVKVHHLVADAWIGPRPLGMVVNHRNGIKTDNRVENLEYVTQKENIRHAIHTLGRHRSGESNSQSKLTEFDVISIRNEYATGRFKQVELGEKYGVCQVVISAIVRYKTWAHVR